MAVNINDGIQFNLDAASSTMFYVPDDTSVTPPVSKIIGKVGPYDGTNVTAISKKLVRTVDNAIQFFFEIKGWNIPTYNAHSIDFEVFLESMGPATEFGPGTGNTPSTTTPLEVSVTNLGSNGTDISTTAEPHREYSCMVLFPANQVPAGTYKVVATIAHDPNVVGRPPEISGFCELGYVRFVDV